MDEPIAHVSGTYGGYVTITLLNPAMVLPDNMALYAGPVAAPVQEPVAWINWNALTGERRLGWQCESEIASEPLYKDPPAAQRQWKELTDDEVDYIADEHSTLQGAIRAVEAKLREKNGGAA